MVILSYEFALCFMIFFIIYWAFARHVKVQNALLLIAGLAFLASWNWRFVLSVLLVWLVSQCTVLGFEILKKQQHKKWLCFFGVGILVAHLCFFKYSNFTIEQLNQTLAQSNNLSPLDIIMPLGLSFYTFQSISYVVDVYRGKIKPLSSAILLAFLSFVPTITSGPIFRASNAGRQWLPGYNSLSNGNNNNNNLMVSRRLLAPYLAIALIMIALVKKLIFAGWLAELWVNPVFANPLQFHGLEVLTAVYAYALQLFFDFSGYTDLAIALALLLGFRLPENFNRPYLATDIQDFWNRWHITLSTWIRDYIYIPLGGSRCSFLRTQFNLMAAFILSGMWHGAGWNFLIWGAMHGAALVWLNFMKKWGVRGWLTRHVKPLAIFMTFHYVCLGWIFFHSATLEQASQMLLGLIQYQNVTLSLSVVPTLLVMGLAWLIYPKLSHTREVITAGLMRLPWWLLPIMLAVYVAVVFALAPEGLPGFIYANF